MTPLQLGGKLLLVKVPQDPPELATWRALTNRRDALVSRIRFGEEAGLHAKHFTDLARALYGDELSEADYASDEAELRTSFVRDGEAAVVELKDLDEAICARPVRGTAPTALLTEQRKNLLMKAVRAVERYVAEPRAVTGASAWALLCAVAGRVLPDSELDSLISKARTWRAEDPYRSGAMIAPYIVNTAAGLPPTARVTRE